MSNFGEGQRLVSPQVEGSNTIKYYDHGSFQSDGTPRPTTSSSISLMKDGVDMVLSSNKQDDAALRGEVRAHSEVIVSVV